MNLTEISDFAIDSIRQFLASLGREVPEITENTRPISDLGLDSQDGIDWVCDLEEKGFNVPNDVKPFVIGKGPQTRTMKEIAKLLQTYETKNREVGSNE